MNDISNGRRQTEIGPVAVRADVVSKPIGVVAETKLIVCTVEASGIYGQIGLVVAFESAAGHHI